MSGLIGHIGLLFQQGGAPPSTAPILLSSASQLFSVSAVAHNISMPATVAASDLLIVACSNGGNTANSVVTTPAGWTQIATFRGATSGTRITLLYKIAAGTEGGTTVNFATAFSTQMSARVWRYQAGTYQATPTATFSAESTSATGTPPSFSPSWGSAVTTGWIVGMGWTSAATPTAYPYATNNQTAATASNVSLATATTDNSTATLTPGNFTLSVSATHFQFTLAIRPV